FYLCCVDYLIFFFFQAEDGIRDFHVTGVQTCALPILLELRLTRIRMSPLRSIFVQKPKGFLFSRGYKSLFRSISSTSNPTELNEIGRASCRERCRSRWLLYHVY